MTIIVNHDRNFWSPEEKPAGLFRILCLGDSLVYGTGTGPDETLPAHLERLLNRAVWERQIEVINAGVSGFAVYDHWNSFVHRWHRFKPDLVVLVLCDNDTQLVSATSLQKAGRDVEYHEHAALSWQENSLHFPHFRIQLEIIGREMRQYGFPCVLAFYDIWDSESRNRIVQVLESLGRQNGLAFLDLSADFIGLHSARAHEEYKANAADDHPSGNAHRIAARSLARFLLQNHFIPGPEAKITSEQDLQHELWQRATVMAGAGYAVEYAYFNLVRLLEEKYTSKARLQMDDQLLQSPEEHHRRISMVQSLGQHYYHLLFWEAYAHLLETTSEPLHVSDVFLMKISRALFILENALGHAQIGYVDYFHSQDPAPDWKVFESLSQTMVRYCEQLAKARDLFQTLGDDLKKSASSLGPLAESGYPERFQALTGRIDSHWRDFEILLNALLNIHACFMSLFQSHGNREDQRIRIAFEGLGRAIQGLAQAFEQEAGRMHLDGLARMSAELLSKPITCCRIRLASKTSEPMALWVQAKAVMPGRRPVSDMQWVVPGGQEHIYHYEFPLFFMGKIRLALQPPADVRFADVQVYILPQKKEQLSFDRFRILEPGHYESPFFLLIP